MINKSEVFLGKKDGAYKAWENNWIKFENIDKNSINGLVQINKLTSKIFFQDHAFSQYHSILGESPEAKESVLNAISIHNFPAEKTVTPESYSELLQATHVKEQLARSYILKHLKEGATFGLIPWEIELLKTSCRIAGEFDEMGYLWRKEVQRNPLNEQAVALGYTNQYSVIRQSDKGPIQVSFAEAFEKQIETITTSINELISNISGENRTQEQIAMADYLQAYSIAIGSRDLDQLPDLWRNVDKVWLGVKGRIQPIASREYDYYDKNAIRVFPDFRLAISNENSELSKPVEATRLSMIKHLDNEFKGIPVFEETKNGMTKIQIFPEAFDIVFAGSLDFQPSGQFLPNEFKIKKEYGIKVFLNLESSTDRWHLALDLAKKVFPHDFTLFERVDNNIDGIAIHLAGHEIGEPLFDTDEVREGLGSKVFRLLNEDAATLSITAIMPHRFKEGEISRKTLENQAIQLLGVYLRYIDFARGAPHLEPYYKGMGLLGLKRMVDSGFIKFIENNLRVDLKAVDKLYELSMRDLKEQIAIADSKDSERAINYLRPIESNDIDFVENYPEVKKMIDVIHT